MKDDAHRSDPIAQALAEALRPMIAEVIREALDERDEGAAPKRELHTVDELASAIAVSRSKVYGLVKDGMPFVEVGAGGVKRFCIPDCIAWLKARPRSAP